MNVEGICWVAMNVCDALGIATGRDAVVRLDEDKRAAVSLTDTSSNGVTQRREVTIVSDPGIYGLFVVRTSRSRRLPDWAMRKG